MDDLRQNMGEFERPQDPITHPSETTKKQPSASTTKGDYIDFEEVK